jgi:uncharacterized protein (TIGR02246 family)
VPARTPAECHSLWREYLHARDLDSLAALYEDHATFIRPGQPAVTGRNAIRELLRGYFAQSGQMELRTAFVVEAGGIALLRGEWTYTSTGADGKPFTNTGTSLEVVRRQPDGTWCYVIDMPFGSA